MAESGFDKTYNNIVKKWVSLHRPQYIHVIFTLYTLQDSKTTKKNNEMLF